MSDAPPPGDDRGGTGADSRERFAADLRKLRLDAGNPTLARLQGETGISRTVLSDAFSGRQLPTARTVDGVVRACGDAPSAWLDRRDALAGLGTRPVPEPVPEAPAAPQAPSIRRSTAGWLIAAAFTVGSIASATTAALVVSNLHASGAPAAQAAGPQITVQTGEHPAFTACIDDAEVVAADTRVDNSLLEIIWSDKCYAGWGRITRYDARADGNTVTVAIYPETAPNGPDRQEATEHDVQSASTMLVVRPSPDTLLCAEGSYTVDGATVDLGEPICT